MVKSYLSKEKKRCDLCHRATNNVFIDKLDGIPFKYCSPAHLLRARAEWEDKKKKGLTPSGSQVRTSMTAEEEIIQSSQEGEANIND